MYQFSFSVRLNTVDAVFHVLVRQADGDTPGFCGIYPVCH